MELFDREQDKSKKLDSFFMRRMTENDRRIRLIEEKVDNMHQKIKIIEDSVLRHNKESTFQLSKSSDNVDNLNNKISEIDSSIKMILMEVKRSAKKTELMEMKKFFDLLSPIKNQFITREEVKKIIRRERR